jgi:hypothetical protein
VLSVLLLCSLFFVGNSPSLPAGIMICVGIWQFVKARNRINSEGPYGFSSRMGRPGGGGVGGGVSRAVAAAGTLLPCLVITIIISSSSSSRHPF